MIPPESEKVKQAWEELEALRAVHPSNSEINQLRTLNAHLYVALCEWRRWRTRMESQ